MQDPLEDSIDSKIEKIKLLEQIEDTKLEEKRTHDTMVMSLNRGVRDALAHAAKIKRDHLEAITRIEALGLQLEKEKALWKAFSGLLDDARKEIQILQEKSMQGVSTVWESRSLLCNSVHSVSDQCDIWALLSKPKSLQLPSNKKVLSEVPEHAIECDDRLKNAIEKHARMRAERDRLLNEPDTGEEFLRLVVLPKIKNALRYSAAMAANFK